LAKLENHSLVAALGYLFNLFASLSLSLSLSLYLRAVFTIYSLRTHHMKVTRDPLNVVICLVREGLWNIKNIFKHSTGYGPAGTY